MALEEVRGLVVDLNKAGDDADRVVDVLKALAAAPVTVPILHELKCGAVVSKLRKHDDAAVSAAAKSLIKQWKGLAAAAGVRPAPAAAPAAQASSSSAPAPDFGHDLPDATRTAARKKLKDVLAEGLAATDAAPWRAAEGVEDALHMKWPDLAKPDAKRDYVAKLRQLSFNLKKNGELRKGVVSGATAPARLLTMSADELATSDVREERERMAQYQHDSRSLDWERKNRDRVDKSIGIDNSKTMYPCGKCKSTKVSNYEKQTRSGDEPMTQFFECSDCGHRWRF